MISEEFRHAQRGITLREAQSATSTSLSPGNQVDDLPGALSFSRGNQVDGSLRVLSTEAIRRLQGISPQRVSISFGSF